jgi:hypothetical protein
MVMAMNIEGERIMGRMKGGRLIEVEKEVEKEEEVRMVVWVVYYLIWTMGMVTFLLIPGL